MNDALKLADALQSALGMPGHSDTGLRNMAANMLRQQAAENERLLADAERYRWLRMWDVDSYMACGRQASLDAAIDQARKP